jgi:hypothetical protein
MSKSKHAKRSRKNKKINQRGGEGECKNAEFYSQDVKDGGFVAMEYKANYQTNRAICGLNSRGNDCTFYTKPDCQLIDKYDPTTDEPLVKGHAMSYRTSS